jgi:hypothetical protein
VVRQNDTSAKLKPQAAKSFGIFVIFSDDRVFGASKEL